MKDFRLYDITDFVMDEDFIRWVHGKSAIDNAFWDNWLTENPSKHLLIAEARQIVESIQMEQRAVAPSEIKSEIDEVLSTIRGQASAILPHHSPPTTHDPAPTVLPHHSPLTTHLTTHLTTPARIAAALILLAGGGIFMLRTTPPKEKKPARFAYTTLVAAPSFTEKTNNTAGTISVSLPDGSAIELAAGSRIGYPNNFAASETRDVYLSGEAFFKIARNPARPFRVIANEIVTKVLGTSFTVRCFEKDTTISITVRTGKVSVYSQETMEDKQRTTSGNPGHGGIILTPNQQLVYRKTEQKFQKILVEDPRFIVPDTLEQGMSYEDKPVERVFDQLGKYYGINIVFDSELLNKCTVTADLTNETFYHKLDLICKAIGAKYEIVDGQVVIQTNGCQ